MPSFGTTVDGIQTGATAGTYRTLLGLKFANTTGHRGRLRKLIVGGGGAAAQDIPLSVEVMRTDNTTDGSSTSVNVNTIGKKDPNSLGSNVSAMGKNYSGEPTTFENGKPSGGPIYSRGTIVLEWDEEQAPKWGPDQTLCILGTPGTDTALNLKVAVEWDEY